MRSEHSLSSSFPEENGLKLCFVTQLCLPYLGGSETQALSLGRELSARGVELFIVARQLTGRPKDETLSGIPVHRVWAAYPSIYDFEGGSVLKNIFAALTFGLSASFYLLRQRHSYQLIHYHGASLPTGLVAVVAKVLRKPMIAKVTGMYGGYEAGSLKSGFWGLGNLLLPLLKTLDRIVATSGRIDRGLIAEGFPRSKIVRIPNHVNCRRFKPVSQTQRTGTRARLGFQAHHIIVTFCGRLLPRKGVDCLLESWKEIAKDYPEAHLILLGEGVLQEKLKAEVKRCGLGHQVRFCGFVSNVEDYLASTDVFVLPSSKEGFPNALLEAMACGLPVVASRIGGVEDLVQDGKNGLLVPPGDPEALTLALRRVMEDRKLARRLGDNAGRTILARYSQEKGAQRYIHLYKSLLAP